MRHHRITIASLLALGALFAAPVFAQDDDENVQYEKKTVLNFDDDTIEGDLKTPDGEFLRAKRRVRHRSLIRIRTEFRREILGSIGAL